MCDKTTLDVNPLLDWIDKREQAAYDRMNKYKAQDDIIVQEQERAILDTLTGLRMYINQVTTFTR